MEKRNVKLPNGGVLEIEASEKFYDAIRFQYNLDKDIEITDDHIRLFMHSTIDNAVAKAEKEIIISG